VATPSERGAVLVVPPPVWIVATRDTRGVHRNSRSGAKMAPPQLSSSVVVPPILCYERLGEAMAGHDDHAEQESHDLRHLASELGHAFAERRRFPHWGEESDLRN